MTDLHPVPGRARRRWLRAVLVIVAVTGAALGGFVVGRVHGTKAETTAPPSGVSVAPPWEPPHAAPSAQQVRWDTSGAWSLPAPAATARTGAGVPYGYPHTDKGAEAAAVNAVVAGMWVKYTLADPWRQLGFLAATAEQSQDRKNRVTKFLAAQRVTPAGGIAHDDRAPRSTVDDAPCGCGFAVLGAEVPDVQVAADHGFRTVRVEAAAFGPGGGGVRMTVTVLRVLLHWEGDWRLADVAAEPAVGGQAVLPAGSPVPARTWLG